MSYLLGIDLGTSSVKALLAEEGGTVAACASEEYGIEIPKIGYAEQNPEMWYQKTCSAIQKVIAKANICANEIKSLSFSGQMHGLVCVDKQGRALCPAIIWPDQRSKHAIDKIYRKLGQDAVFHMVQNKIATGFLIASLYWMYEHEKGLYDKIGHVMFPKDYVKYRICGRIVTDDSDAAGGLAFDNVNLVWSSSLIEGLGLSMEVFPKCLPSLAVVGQVGREAASQTGLCEHTKVVNGGADQCMQSIGNGILDDGVFSCNIGTGGQVACASSMPVTDPQMRISTFAHVIPNKWNLMGASLSAGNALKWLCREIISCADYRQLNEQCNKIPVGSEGLVFLPYLAGERTPHMNPSAKGMFCGLALKHGRFHMARSVMEGVVYALRDCMEVLMEMGMKCERMVAAGGGAKSEVWLQMQADIFNCEITKSNVEEQAALGAAIVAGVGANVYADMREACDLFVSYDEKTYSPIAKNVVLYEEYYELFKELYQLNERIFSRLDKVGKR